MMYIFNDAVIAEKLRSHGFSVIKQPSCDGEFAVIADGKEDDIKDFMHDNKVCFQTAKFAKTDIVCF